MIKKQSSKIKHDVIRKKTHGTNEWYIFMKKILNYRGNAGTSVQLGSEQGKNMAISPNIIGLFMQKVPNQNYTRNSYWQEI